MKKIMKLSILAIIATTSLSAKALDEKSIDNLVKGNKLLSSETIQVKKGEKVSDNLSTLQLGIKFNSPQGIQERPAQAFVAKIDGKDYTFLGGGYDKDGEKISLSLDKKIIEDGVLWSAGKGKEVIYVVTNPSCSWCAKLEDASAKSQTFYENYTVKKIVMPFFDNAVEKSMWILAADTDAEKAERYKKVMVDNDNTWVSFKPTPEQKVKIDAELAKSLAAAKELDAQGTPAVFDSKFRPINNWPELIK